MGTPKRTEIEKTTIKSWNGDLRYKSQFDPRAIAKGNSKLAKKFFK